MPLFRVTVEKMQRQSGVIEIEALTASDAQDEVDRMMVDHRHPLQTSDSRIEWDEPQYERRSFATTGDVD